MMRRALGLLGCLAIGLLVTGAPAGATDWTSAITDDGSVFVVRQAQEPSRLILEVQTPAGEHLDLPVPGTEGPETEQSPSLTVEGTGVYLVWSARRTIHAALYVTSWSQDEGWGEVVEFSGDAFSSKVNPKIAVTRDRFLTLDSQDRPVEHTRALIHLVWWDESGIGNRPFYLALSVLDGALQPFENPLDLYSLAGEPFSATAGEAHPLARDVVLESGEHGVRIGFGDPEGTRYGVVDIEIPAGSLEFLADEARAQVIRWGRENPGASRERLASHMLEFSYALGKRLLAEDVAAYVSGQLTQAILNLPADRPLESVGDEARAQIIRWGSRIRGGIRQLHEEARAQVIRWGSRYTGDAPPGASILARVGVQELPTIPFDRQIRSFLGPERVILAWNAGDSLVRYTELDLGDPASEAEVRALALSPTFPREMAYDSLERRAARR